MFSRFLGGIREFRSLGAGEEYSWKNGRMAIVDLPVDEDLAREWLSPALRLAKPARIRVFVAYYPETSFGSAYHEAAVFIHTKLFGIFPAAHCPWMLVDDDTALILGREMLGYPKKMGTVTMAEEDGVFTASAARRGVEVIRMSGRIGAPVAGRPPAVGGMVVNMRSLINVIFPGHLLAWRFKERVHECRVLEDFEVTLTSSETDPVGIATSSRPAEPPTIRTCDLGFGKLPWVLRVWLVNPMLINHLTRLRAL